jgi:hypothetical protein
MWIRLSICLFKVLRLFFNVAGVRDLGQIAIRWSEGAELSCPSILDRVFIGCSLGAGAFEAAFLGATPWSCPVDAGFPFEGECVVGSDEPAADACVVASPILWTTIPNDGM